MDDITSALDIFSGVTDRGAKFSRANTALQVAYNGLPSATGKVAATLLRWCVARQPYNKSERELVHDEQTLSYLTYGRHTDCFDIDDLVRELYMPEEIEESDKTANTSRYLKQLLDGMVFFKFVVCDGKHCAKTCTYSRHFIQWGTKVVLPCTLVCLSRQTAYKNACYVTAAYMSKHAKGKWADIDEGVRLSKEVYCDQYLWGLVCRAHEDVRKLIPTRAELGCSTDEYAKFVYATAKRFDQYYGIDIDEPYIKMLPLPACIKTPMIMAIRGELSAEARHEFVHAYYYRHPDSTVEITTETEFKWKNRVVNFTTVTPDPIVKITTENVEKPVATVNFTTDCHYQAEDKQLKANDLQKADFQPLRGVNLPEEELQEEGGPPGGVGHELATAAEGHVDAHAEPLNEGGPYNATMTTTSKDPESPSDKALSEQDVDQFAYVDKSLVPTKKVGRRSPVAKTPKEIFDGQESLHRHEMRKRKAMHQEPPTVMNNTKVFVDTFRRIVSEETGGQASFPHSGSLMMECQSAQRVWDFLRHRRSFHQDVLMGWMRFAGGQFKKRVRSRRTITVSMLLPTWDGYKPFKPAIVVPAVSAQPLRPMSVKDTIGASMVDIFGKDRSRQEAIWLGMMAWGIPMTAHWIAPTSKNPEAEIRMSLAAHMDTPVRRGDVKDVFSTSLRWQALVAPYGLPLLDWQAKFADMADKVGAFKAYPNRPDDNDYAQAFVAGRLVKETT